MLTNIRARKRVPCAKGSTAVPTLSVPCLHGGGTIPSELTPVNDSADNPHADQPVPLPASTVDRVTGLDIRIDRIGSGPPLVFLNGLLGMNEHWFAVLGPLSKRWECILLQPPLLEMKGKGCSVDGVTQLTIALLESIIDEPAVLLGNSLGGHVSLRVAMERPDLVKGLALVGSSGLFERTFEKGVQHSPSREWIDNKIRGLFHDKDFPRIDALVDMAHEKLSQRSAARALVKLGRSAKRDHLGEELHRVTCPVVIPWGRQDAVTPPEVAEQFHSLLPDSRLVWIDECGHAPQIEKPDAVADAVHDFIADIEAGVFSEQSSRGTSSHGAA